VQLDSIKPGISRYGWKPTPWRESQGVQPSPQESLRVPAASAVRRLPSWNQTADFVLISSYTATTASIVVCDEAVLLNVGYAPLVLDEATALALAGPIEVEPSSGPASTEAASQSVRNPILEMRPARRSLEDKARKELSAFDREYPW
jgi:hypothetical protein